MSAHDVQLPKQPTTDRAFSLGFLLLIAAATLGWVTAIVWGLLAFANATIG